MLRLHQTPQIIDDATRIKAVHGGSRIVVSIYHLHAGPRALAAAVKIATSLTASVSSSGGAPRAASDRHVDVGRMPTVHLMQFAAVTPRGPRSTTRPLAPALPAPDVAGVLPGAAARPPQVPLILLVDDNSDARVMYKVCLEHEGFACVTAQDGREAIARISERRPALILMDASMPGMDGWEATLRIKADPVTRDIPIYMLTAHAFPEHRRHAVEVGANGFLAKPILPDDLASEIRRALRLPIG